VQLLNDRARTERGLQVSANAIAVGQIATTFLHEAKNSLSGISLTAQSLHEDIERETDLKSKKDYIDRLVAIQAEVDRFDTLSRRLQRFTQQGLTPQKKEVYLNSIVQQTLVLMGSALRSKGLKKEIKLDPILDTPSGRGKGKGHPILADEDQIQQVLMNLILNAVAASGDRRPLVVETRNLSDSVEIKVTDHGTGIQGKIKGNLFKPFFTTKKDGVGLGLFLSRILVEDNHGGSIDVSSTPGKGATFTVRLPKS
jgi:signal transduction histidine kinase